MDTLSEQHHVPSHCFTVFWCKLTNLRTAFAWFSSDAIFRMYSKSMSNPESKFNVGMDAGYKHVMAESAYRDAADATGLTDTYHKLQAMQTWKGKV